MAAVNGLMIYYSQEARMYAMAAFFVSGAMYYFIKRKREEGRGKKERKAYLLYFIFMAMALYSHYLTWLLLPFLAIWGLRYVLPVLLTVPWWPMLTRQLSSGLAAAENPVWADLSRTNFKNLALVAVKFVTGRVPWPESWWGEIGVGLVVLVFWTMVMIGGIRVIREIRQIGQIRDRRLMLALWAFGPLALGAIIGLFIPVFTYFRFLFAVPAILILAVNGISRLGKLAELGKFGVLAMILAFSLWYLLIPENQREDWRGAVAELRRQDEAPMVIIHPAVRPPFEYYDQRSEVRGQRSEVVSSQRSEVRGQRSVWYIPYAQEIFDPEDSTRMRLRGEGYVRNHEKHFRGVTLERWDIGIAMTDKL